MPAGNSLFEDALRAEGVTGKLADLARSIYTQESSKGKNTQTSNAGAMGGMQIIPSTFGQVADKGWSIADPLQNARAGIRYLKVLDKQAGGDPALTAAGYYGGPGALEKARQGVAVADPRNPAAPNTLQYANQVVARAGLAPTTPGSSTQGVPAQVAAVAPGPVPPAAQAAPVVAAAPVVQDAPAAPPVMAQGPDPWQAFLKNVNVARSQPTAPIPENFDFGSPGYVPLQVAAIAPRNQAVNFSAFGHWKGRTA
jgi:hypothetical protein